MKAQNNFHSKTVAVFQDTIRLDTLSIVPQSVQIFDGNKKLNDSLYTVDFLHGNIVLDSKTLLKKHIYHLKVSYRTFPINLSQSYFHKDISQIQTAKNRPQNPFSITYNNRQESAFDLKGLNKSGSISRGITIGNTQDLSVNSDLNLQISGKITDGVNIKAAISDRNLPIQPEGNTQQLQQFDNVYVKLYNQHAALTAGDFTLKNPSSYFMRFNKRAQGGEIETHFYVGKSKNVRDKGKLSLEVSGAASKGKYARNIIQGVEGNQGPYKLTGADGETYIVVLAGTEQVFLDGKLLKRGADYDYVIDYNAAEITFTANHLITQDSRIIVTFQYSSLSYVRSLFYASGSYQKKNMQVNVNFYNEQDAKNQPLQQDLSSAQKKLLAQVGDSVDQAVVPSAVDKGFDNSQVRYKKVPQPGFDSIYVYSTDSDSAVYEVDFSFVGVNKGNYIRVQSTANGSVYQWVAPIGGVLQGSYMPYSVLIAPKKTQMLTVNTTFKLGKNTDVSWEGAMSNYDMNTFSNIGNQDDVGLATRIKIDNKSKIGHNKTPTAFGKGAMLEFTGENFNAIEDFRPVEFNRDWNIRGLTEKNNQIYATGYLSLTNKKRGLLKYTTSLFNSGDEFNGFKNDLNFLYRLKGFEASGAGSYLNSQGFQNTSYLKYNATISQKIGKIKIGGYGDQEINRLYNSDTLLGNSYQWNILKAFVQMGDSLGNSFGASYKYQEDYLPLISGLKLASIANNFSLNGTINKSKINKLNFQVTYRKLNIADSALAQNQPEEDILGKMNYDLKLLKGAVVSNTYYTIGSGLELKQEYQYLEVAPGQGIYAWTDYNGDGIKQLNEFQVAAFQDEADYIRVDVPSNQYVKVYTNQFNELFYIRPEVLWANANDVKKFISRFSDKLALSGQRKTGKRAAIFNPFTDELGDTALVSTSNSFINSLYFNRNSSKFDLEYDFAQNTNKDITTNGFESASDKYNSLQGRVNLTKYFFLNEISKLGLKSNESEIASENDYQYNYSELSSELGFQPSTKFRLTIKYSYSEKKNQPKLGGQQAYINNATSELRWNIPSKASFTANFSVIYINYNSLANTSLAYEMLSGLEPGKNFTWGLGWQQNLAKNLQMNILYSGRKTQGNKVVNTGNVQIRAFF